MLKIDNTTRYSKVVYCNYGGYMPCPYHVIYDGFCWTPDEDGEYLHART